jgi:hypothetical protein
MKELFKIVVEMYHENKKEFFGAIVIAILIFVLFYLILIVA